jgi:hypothetical protein
VENIEAELETRKKIIKIVVLVRLAAVRPVYGNSSGGFVGKP